MGFSPQSKVYGAERVWEPESHGTCATAVRAAAEDDPLGAGRSSPVVNGGVTVDPEKRGQSEGRRGGDLSRSSGWPRGDRESPDLAKS